MARIVFDTDQGRLCPECNRPIDACACEVAAPPTDGVIRVRQEKRRGKTVTIAQGFSDRTALRDLAKELKRKLGTGGTVSDDSLELQGDYRNQVIAQLRTRGFVVKG